jgi:hypothetical protein
MPSGEARVPPLSSSTVAPALVWSASQVLGQHAELLRTRPSGVVAIWQL